MGRDAHQSRPTPSSRPPGAAEVIGPSDLGNKRWSIAEVIFQRLQVPRWDMVLNPPFWSHQGGWRFLFEQLEQGLLQNLEKKLFAEAPLLRGLTWHEELNSKIQTQQSKSFPALWGVPTSISEALFIKHNSDIVLNFEPKSGYKDRRTSMHPWHETSKYVIPTKDVFIQNCEIKCQFHPIVCFYFSKQLKGYFLI